MGGSRLSRTTHHSFSESLTLNDMPAYEIFGKFYDAVMGDRSRPAEHLEKLIRSANPNARNVLELGCGTGSILKHLQHNYKVSGLDTSSRMLSIARHKVLHADFSGRIWSIFKSTTDLT